MFLQATSKTHFLFNGDYYDQIDGVAMGSPLAPILANLFLGHHEGTWLNEYEGIKPSYFKRYVDDVFAVFSNENEATIFLSYLNSKHESIKFTMEVESNKQLPFLDVQLDNSGKTFLTNIYRKVTFTGVLTNYLSFTAMRYKIGLVKCLIDRVFKINNTWLGFHKDLKKVFTFLKQNCYPEEILYKVTRKYLDNKYERKSSTHKDDKVAYITLPYIGHISNQYSHKIRNICKKYDIKIDVRVAFQSYKLSKCLSYKDKLTIKSFVVYKFLCASCNACYVGYSTRHFNTRVNEHLSDKQSHIYKHLNENPQCKHVSDKSCFSILDSANNEYELKIKEALHIHWLKPTINKQLKSFKLTLCV